MFKKIIKKLKFGSCKATTDNANVSKESEKKVEDSPKWNTIASTVILSGKGLHTLLIKFVNMKKFIQKISNQKQVGWNKVMSTRCKVCNTLEIMEKYFGKWSIRQYERWWI